MAIPFGVIVTIQIGNVINQLGAQSLLGAGSGFAVIQQSRAVGVGHAARWCRRVGNRCRSRGAQRAQEIDAMRTMGIDPIQRLVVPRIIASVVVAPLLALFIILVGVVAAYYVAVLGQDVGAARTGSRSARSRRCEMWVWQCSRPSSSAS